MGLATRTLHLSGPPLIAAVGALLVHTLPESVLHFLTVWTLLSLPLGILIGHCALNEDDGGV